jgi:hypothetical protein
MTPFSFPFAGMLAVLFIGLKITGLIAWNWFWVLSPLWIPLALVLAFLGIVFVAGACVGAWKHLMPKDDSED